MRKAYALEAPLAVALQELGLPLDTDLGLPLSARVQVWRYPGEVAKDFLAQRGKGGDWHRYTVFLVGVRMQPRRKDAPLPPWPSAGILLADGATVVDVQLRLWRVHIEDSPLYREARWRPGHDRTVTLHGLEHIRKLPERRVLHEALQLLDLRYTRDLRGRRPGSGYFRDADHFKATVFPFIRARHRDGQPYTEADVCAFLSDHLPQYQEPRAGLFAGCDVRTLRAWVKKYFGPEATWDDVIREALR